MTTQILAIIGALIALGVSIFAYYTSDKTKIRQLKARQNELEIRLRVALAKNDTVAISLISIELNRVRTQLASFNAR